MRFLNNIDFRRLNLPALFSRFRVLILFLLYTLAEIIDSYYPNLAHTIIENTTEIDPNNMTNITGYAYFSINDAVYPTVFDEFLNITVFGGYIYRKVEYCQHQQNKNSFGIFNSNPDIYTYSTLWANNYINSSNFFDKNYVNPPLSIEVNKTTLSNDVKIGNLTVLSSFYTKVLNLYYFDPKETAIENFTYSNASSDFEYIKRGYFYHSVSNKSMMPKIEKIQKKLTKKDETSDDKLYEAQQEMFSKCSSGDIRIRYYVYGPKNVTYFGYVKNYTMFPVSFDSIQLGITVRGCNQSLKKLVKAFMPGGIYNDDDSLDDFLSFCFVITVKMKLFFDILSLILYVFRNDPIRASYWLLVVSFANVLYRSLIWTSWQLNLKLWTTSLLAILILGFIAGIWKIQFFQTNNQVFDIHVHFDRNALENMQQIITNMADGQIHVRINRIDPNNPNQFIHNLDPNNLYQNNQVANVLRPNYQNANNLNVNAQNANNLNINNQNIFNRNRNNENFNNQMPNNQNIYNNQN